MPIQNHNILLVTACGCTKIVNAPDAAREWMVALHPGTGVYFMPTLPPAETLPEALLPDADRMPMPERVASIVRTFRWHGEYDHAYPQPSSRGTRVFR